MVHSFLMLFGSCHILHQSEDELFNILDCQDIVVENMVVVLTVELYTLAKGVRSRVTDKSELLYMIGLCICFA